MCWTGYFDAWTCGHFTRATCWLSCFTHTFTTAGLRCDFVHPASGSDLPIPR
ncbi:hypothetical protein LTR39_003176, partial [Cryomyces antarcticus]